MYAIKATIDFLLSQWLWGVTFDWGHMVLTLFFMIVLIKVALKKNIIHAIGISLAAHGFSFFVFTALVVGVIIHLFNWHYSPIGIDAQLTKIDVMRACLFLALIYSVLQTGFFLLLQKFTGNFALPYVVIAWISNGVAALLSYSGIRVILWYAL